MGVNCIDLILVILVLMVAAIETKRGFGRAFFDFSTLMAALYLASMMFPGAAASLELSADKSVNGVLVYSLLVVFVGAACWFIGKLAYDSTLISLDSFDPFLGGVLGIGVAVIVGHALTKSLALIGTVNGKLPEMLTKSMMGMEFYDFKTYHNVITFLSKLAE